MIDFQELKGSEGNSSVLMDAYGHRIYFTLSDAKVPGYIEIRKSGWMGFTYECFIDNQKVKEATEGVAHCQEMVFKVRVTSATFTDEMDDPNQSVAWYLVHTVRLRDGASSTVHRRFREFAELNSQVKQNLKGHHMRETLPPLPEKPLKILTDHKDPAFIQERCRKLEQYLSALVLVPHVSKMVCIKSFVGVMDQIREYSLAFYVPTLGLSLVPSPKDVSPFDMYPAVVGSVFKVTNEWIIRRMRMMIMRMRMMMMRMMMMMMMMMGIVAEAPHCNS